MQQMQKLNKCQGNWCWEDDLLPHPDPDNDGDQPEPLPGHGVPPREAQPADQGCQGVEEVKCQAIPNMLFISAAACSRIGMLNFIIKQSFLNCLSYKIPWVFLGTFILYISISVTSFHLYIFTIHCLKELEV